MVPACASVVSARTQSMQQTHGQQADLEYADARKCSAASG